jgi:hypothetical protein
MTNDLKQAIELMINEEIVKAKQLIENNLYAKLGKALEEKLMEFAPTVFNEEKEEDEEDEEKEEKDESEDEGEDDDAEEEDSESDEEDEEDDSKEMNEEFENQLVESLYGLIAEIEQETGRQLTKEEIEIVTNEFINEYAILTEKLDAVGEEDEDIDNDGDEDETDSYLHNRRKKIGKAMKHKKKG